MHKILWKNKDRAKKWYEVRKKVKWKTKHIACGLKWKRKEIDLGKWKCTHKGSIAFDVSLVTAFMQHLRNFSLGFMVNSSSRERTNTRARVDLWHHFWCFACKIFSGFPPQQQQKPPPPSSRRLRRQKCSRTAIAFFSSSSAFIVYFWTLFCAVLGSIKLSGMRWM